MHEDQRWFIEGVKVMSTMVCNLFFHSPFSGEGANVIPDIADFGCRKYNVTMRVRSDGLGECNGSLCYGNWG